MGFQSVPRLISNIEKIGEWWVPMSSMTPERQHCSIELVKILSMHELLQLVLWVAKGISGKKTLGKKHILKLSNNRLESFEQINIEVSNNYGSGIFRKFFYKWQEIFQKICFIPTWGSINATNINFLVIFINGYKIQCLVTPGLIFHSQWHSEIHWHTKQHLFLSFYLAIFHYRSSYNHLS